MHVKSACLYYTAPGGRAAHTSTISSKMNSKKLFSLYIPFNYVFRKQSIIVCYNIKTSHLLDLHFFKNLERIMALQFISMGTGAF